DLRSGPGAVAGKSLSRGQAETVRAPARSVEGIASEPSGWAMTKQEILQVKLRMPKAFYRRLQRDAERNGQTVNAEILHRLQQTYDESRRDLLSEMIEALRAELEEQRALRTALDKQRAYSLKEAKDD